MKAGPISKKHRVDSPDDGSKTERVYRDMRRRIRELELLPGSRLDKNQIADAYGVSRAPVSDAIARLAAEGLVDVFPQSGSFVSPIRSAELSDSLLIRTGLEVEVVRRAALLRNAELIEGLEENLKAQVKAAARSDHRRMDDLDDGFHMMIARAVQSTGAMRLLDRTRAILDRPRFQSLPRGGRTNETVEEHRRIADAIRTGDPDLAAAAMRCHLTMVARVIDQSPIVERPAQTSSGR